MRKLLLLPLAVIVAGVIVVATAAAATHKTRACAKPDRAGNWEVVLGKTSTSKAAASLKARATAKRLHASTERDGCAMRWEVVLVASTQTKANAMKAVAVKDGFKSAAIEKS